MELEKKINVHYQTSSLIEGEAFLFEIEKGDLPYAIFGSDCMEIARAIGKEVIPYRIRESTGELVPASFDARGELYNDLMSGVFSFDENGEVRLGGKPGSDFLPNVGGVAVKDANLAHHVAKLFEERGYHLVKKYS